MPDTIPGNVDAVPDFSRQIRFTVTPVARTGLALGPVIVWLNGTHGAGKTTTSALVQQLVPDSRVFDAEKVGETLMDITPGLPRRTTSSTCGCRKPVPAGRMLR
jgi:hypothetical protein